MRRFFAYVFAMTLIGYGFWMGLPTAPEYMHVPPAWTAAYIYAAPVNYTHMPVPNRPSAATVCMAQVLYFEGRYEPTEGLEAIAATVLNRQRHHDYPRSICGVVYQPNQYSWTSDDTKWAVVPPHAFIAMAIAFIQKRDILEHVYQVTHFHRSDIRPRWATTLRYQGTYGQHRFYTQYDTL